MKKLLLLLIFALLLSSCTGSHSEKEPQTTEPEVTAEEKKLLTVVCDGETEFEIIRPDGASGAEAYLFTSFHREFKERYSCDIAGTSDLMILLKPTAPDAKEILIGATNREDSAALAEKLASAGGNRFGIAVTDSRIVITGTSWYQEYLALDYFFSHFESTDENGKLTVTAECGFEYISEDSEDVGFDITALISEGRGVAFAAANSVLSFKARGDAGKTQGGCTDGKYVYVGMVGKSDGTEYGVICKYDPATGELIKSSEHVPTLHTNDMTYDSKNDRIVVATLDAGWTRLSFIDADTLEYLGDFTAPVPIRGLEYLPKTNQYVAAGFNVEIMLLDENFNKLSSHICEDQNMMTQGLYSDGDYVYDPRSASNESYHLIVIEDMEGNLAASSKLYGIAGAEPEHMYKLNGEFYMGCNKTNRLYRLDIMPVEWWQ